MQFGDMSFQSEPIGDFEGVCSAKSMTEKLLGKASHYVK